MHTSTDPHPVAVLCGFWPHTVDEAAHHLLTERPELRLVRYDDESRTPARDAAALVHDIAAAAAQAGPAGLLVVVPRTYEPDQIRVAWRSRALGRPPSLTTVVPADLVLDGLTDEATLRAVGLHQAPADTRSVGDLVSRQIEQADAVLLTGQPDGDDWEAERLGVLLHRLAPWAGQWRTGEPLPPLPAGRGEPVATLTRGLRGYAVGLHEPVGSHGVTACVFRARRPLHPGRLYQALDELTEGVLRSRGHFWLASRPELVMTWESSGGLTIGPDSGWLADLPDEHWHDVDPERRLAAALDWDPYYGDRHHHLAFVGIDLDPVRIHRTLAGCLLTDDELSQGEEAWHHFPDPFRRSYPAPAASEP